MQCVIDIQYCCQKVAMVDAHCSIPWNQKKYWLLKENAAYRLQSALYYIPLNKKNYSCKKTIMCGKMQYIHQQFDEVKPHSHFFCMAFAFNGEASLLQKNCLDDNIITELKGNILAEMQYANKCNTSLMKLSLL